MESKYEKCLFIDVGTSKIVICTIKDNRINHLSGSFLQKPYSSAIYVKNEIWTGYQLDGRKLDPQFHITNIKSFIARAYEDPFIRDLQETSSFNIGKDANDNVGIEVMENDKLVLKSPSELMAIVLREALNHFCPGDAFDYLYMAYPPSFSPKQIEEFKTIAQSLGSRHVSFMSESEAAGIHFGCLHLREHEHVVIADIGAGTLDLSLMKKEDGQLKEIQRGGDSTLGGNTVTQLLFFYIRKSIQEMGGNVQDIRKLYEEVEKCKIELATSSTYTIDYEDICVLMS